MKTSLKTMALCAALAAVAVACEKEKVNNVVVPDMKLGNITWAGYNVGDFQQFATRPDMYTKFYQWNRSKAWAATGEYVSGWNSTEDKSATWTVNPCPEGWRLPTRAEYEALDAAGSTWANANTRGNAVAGRFYGPNHATASLPNNMVGCVFFPASGYRLNTNGALNSQGSWGNGWSSTQASSFSGYSLSFLATDSNPASRNSKPFGFSVRCVKDN
jgi:uncharacterized protein (TIGR02145 family)